MHKTVEGPCIIMKDPKVKAILINIFGGIVWCDRALPGCDRRHKSIGNINIPSSFACKAPTRMWPKTDRQRSESAERHPTSEAAELGTKPSRNQSTHSYSSCPLADIFPILARHSNPFHPHAYIQLLLSRFANRTYVVSPADEGGMANKCFPAIR